MAKRQNLTKDGAELQVGLGKAVKVRRSQLGLTQEELAWRANLHRTYIADIERGGRNITLRNIAQLALALQVSVAGLLSDAQKGGGEGALGTIEVANGGVGEVVLIEDNPADVELTLRAFQRAKFINPVRVARDGQEALELLFGPDDAEPRVPLPVPQLILLDLMLPKLSGLEILTRIKKNERLKAVPVVVLSSSHEDANIIECARLGAENYIIKPVLFDNFCKVTSRLPLQWALLKSGSVDFSTSS